MKTEEVQPLTQEIAALTARLKVWNYLPNEMDNDKVNCFLSTLNY